MFDIGFPELLLVSVVALLVIGPERLPETVRTIALWIGRIRRSLANIKTELENEIGADEIRQQLHNESVMKDLREAKDGFNEIVAEGSQTVTDLKRATNEPPANIAPESGNSTTNTSQDNKGTNDGPKQSESGR